jgi:hypothetical protein
MQAGESARMDRPAKKSGGEHLWSSGVYGSLGVWLVTLLSEPCLGATLVCG